MTETILQPEYAIPSTDAVFLGRFDSDSAEWHKLREGANIGGSDVSTICGLNPWVSPFTFWAKKTKRIDENFEGSEAMEWGTLLEPVIIEKFMRKHPEIDTIASPGTYRHADRDWQIANPDGVGYDASTNTRYIIEIKTAKYEDNWIVPAADQMGTADGVPPYYRTQVQWYLQTFGYEKAIVAVLFGGSKYREFEILADEFEQSVNLSRVTHWRELYLLRGEQPDYDGALNTYETIREMHPEIDLEQDCDLGDLGMHLALAQLDAEKAEAHLTEMKSRVLDAMGTARRGYTEGVLVATRQARGTGRPYLVIKKN